MLLTLNRSEKSPFKFLNILIIRTILILFMVQPEPFFVNNKSIPSSRCVQDYWLIWSSVVHPAQAGTQERHTTVHRVPLIFSKSMYMQSLTSSNPLSSTLQCYIYLTLLSIFTVSCGAWLYINLWTLNGTWFGSSVRPYPSAGPTMHLEWQFHTGSLSRWP